MSDNLYEALLPHVPERASTSVLVTDDGEIWTRERVEVLSGRIAALLSQVGVRPGDRVAVQVEKSAAAVCLYLGCLKAGAVYLPLNTAYTVPELAHFLGDARPAVVVKGADYAELPVEAAHLPSFTLRADGSGSLIDAAESLEPLDSSVAREADDLAAILYTSGTTGRSKGAMITHGNLTFMAAALRSAWRATEDDVLLHALPVFHAHGLFIALNTMLMAGGSMIFLPKFTANAVLKELPRSTIFMGVPTFYTRLLADDRLDAEVCGNVRLFVSGSAPLSVPTFEAFLARTGHAILERYASTETTVITANPLDGERIPGTVGYALPGVSVRIIEKEKTARTLPAGEVGEVALKGPNVFKGYWGLAEATAKEFTPDGYFRSGDLGRMGDDGRLTIVGRDKDLIISGGYNVYPGEVEAALARIDGVADCAVFGLPHADFGEGVVAVIERKVGFAGLTAEVVLSELASRLARYKLPKAIVMRDSMPRNAMGKIQKNELRRLHENALAE